MAPSSLILEQHHRPPFAGAFMARAFVPSPGLAQGGSLPRIMQRWTGLRIEPAQVAAFRAATAVPNGEAISVLYPHVLGFRLQMALLTHPAFPLPIWRALQIRNRLVRLRDIRCGEVLDLETQTGAHRWVAKGVEIDLHSRLSRGSDCVWHSEVTYFYRGRFGDGVAEVPPPPAPELSGAPVVAQFQMPAGDGWRFGQLAGDYNGIHWWPWYARRFGFAAAFLHPQRVAGLCLAHLPRRDSAAQTLELWIKGPVFYGAQVALRAEQRGDAHRFGLSIEAIRALRWRGAGATARHHEKLLLACYWMAIVADAIATVLLLWPAAGNAVLQPQPFEPSAMYLYVSRVAGGLMLGWTVLLVWALRQPIARADVLLMTLCPVIALLAVAAVLVVSSGQIALARMWPMFVFYAVAVVLLVPSYRWANRQRGDLREVPR
jgi:hypothetical protein